MCDVHKGGKVRLLIIGHFDDEHCYIRKLYDSYAAAGFHVRFVGFDRRGHLPSRVTLGTMSCEFLMHGWGYSNWKLLLAYPLWAVRAFYYCLHADVDLVHACGFETAIPVALALFLGRMEIPFIYDVQDNADLSRKWPRGIKKMVQLMDGWVVKRSASVLMPDELRIVGQFERWRKKIHVLLLTAPQDTGTRAKRRAVDGQLVVLAAGLLSSLRGIGLLLDALERMTSVRVIMAGKFAERSLEARAAKMSGVEFRGWLTPEAAVTLGLEADVMFSFYDPSVPGNVLANGAKWLAAMVTGTPILCNSELANANWLEREGVCYLCPYDAGRLAEVLEWIRTHPHEAREKGRNGRLLYESRFAWQVMEKRLHAIAKAALS